MQTYFRSNFIVYLALGFTEASIAMAYFNTLTKDSFAIMAIVVLALSTLTSKLMADDKGFEVVMRYYKEIIIGDYILFVVINLYTLKSEDYYSRVMLMNTVLYATMLFMGYAFEHIKEKSGEGRKIDASLNFHKDGGRLIGLCLSLLFPISVEAGLIVMSLICGIENVVLMKMIKEYNNKA